MRATIRRAARVAAVALSLGAAAAAPAAAAEYGFQPGTQSVRTSTPQAGAHPDVEVSFKIERDARRVPLGGTEVAGTALPPGLVGNPTVVATCAMTDVIRMQTTRGGRACPREAAVGTLTTQIYYPAIGLALPVQTRRLYRLPTAADEPAAFGSSILGYPTKLVASLRSDGDYGLTVAAPRLPESLYVGDVDVEFWGVPADRQGPGDRWDGPATIPETDPDLRFGGSVDGAPRLAFMSNPSRCTGEPLSYGVFVRPWVDQRLIHEQVQTPAITGCEAVPFEPSIEVRPATTVAGAPTGYAVDVVVPQDDSAERLATAHLKDATVVLPEGVAISPPVADGLQTCADAQLGLDSRDRETCPAASKIGSVSLDTPLLDEPLNGSIYQGTQESHDPASGEMYRIFLTAAGSGIRIKLRGAISVNPATGQLTTTFRDNPQLPFDRLSLTFKDGDRAPLVNPPTCGEKTATATLTAWSGAVRDVSTTYTIDQGCTSGLFTPSFNAGTLSARAGAFSPFVISVGRADGHQDLDRLTFAFPPGVVGMISSVPLCADAAANAGTCGEGSRIGSLTVAAGTGGLPLQLPGRLYLTESYGGGPFGISIVVPAIAGPFDLGTVVVRGAIHVDRHDARITVASDPLPAVVGGVPLHMRAVDVRVDRERFMFNATNCQPKAVDATLTGKAQGRVVTGRRYQADGCKSLPYDARLRLIVGARGQTRQDSTTPLTAVLTQPAGQTNSKSINVLLPRSINARLEALNAACELADYRAERCGDAGLIGDASVVTPVLRDPLRGRVHLVRNPARRLPDIMVALRGQVAIDVTSIVRVDRRTFRLGTAFDTIPDIPLTRFRMTLHSGRGALLSVARNLCSRASRTAPARVVYGSQALGVRRVYPRVSTHGCRGQARAAPRRR